MAETSRSAVAPRIDRPEIPAEYGITKASEHVEWEEFSRMKLASGGELKKYYRFRKPPAPSTRRGRKSRAAEAVDLRGTASPLFSSSIAYRVGISYSTSSLYCQTQHPVWSSLCTNVCHAKCARRSVLDNML